VSGVVRSWGCGRLLRHCCHGLALWGLVGGIASSVAFGQTANLEVVATVAASCTLVGGTLNFGTYRPEDSAATEGEATIHYDCPEGTAIRLSLSPGQHAQSSNRAMSRDGGGGTLSYDLYQDAARSQVWGDQGDAMSIASTPSDDTAVDVYGEIHAEQSAPPGTYRDTVLITLVVE
jgi:spore coat protein U domain-containing protein, fimbrial subunit CupE1/2/3/6